MNNQKSRTNLMFQVRPVFHVESQLLMLGLPAIMYLLFIILLFAIIVEHSILNGVLFLIGSIIFVLVVVGFVAAVTKKQYGSVIYTFYKTKFEYKDENKDAVLKEIKYEEITKIILKRNIFDRIFKMGTVWIHLNDGSCMVIPSIDNAKKTYKAIKQITNK